MSCSKYVWVKTAKRRQPAGSHNDGATTVGAGTDVDAENFQGAQPFDLRLKLRARRALQDITKINAPAQFEPLRSSTPLARRVHVHGLEPGLRLLNIENGAPHKMAKKTLKTGRKVGFGSRSSSVVSYVDDENASPETPHAAKEHHQLPDDICINGAVYRKSQNLGGDEDDDNMDEPEPAMIMPRNSIARRLGPFEGMGVRVTAAERYPSMQHFCDMDPQRPHSGATSMILPPPGSPQMPRRQFNYSRLGYGRFRHPNLNVDFRPNIHMEQAMNGMQPRPPPPFCPWERGPVRFMPFNSPSRHHEFNHCGRFCGPVNFRPPPRYAPYPRPEFVRRDCSEVSYEHVPRAPIPVWRQDVLRPFGSSSLEYTVQRNVNEYNHELHPGLPVPEWHLRNGNGCSSENSQLNIPVFRGVPNYPSPPRTLYSNEVPKEEIWRRQQQQSYEWTTSLSENKVNGSPHSLTNAECREDSCVHHDDPTEEADPAQLYGDESISSETEEPVTGTSFGVEDAHEGEAGNGNAVRKNQSELGPQENEELAKAIKLFLQRHVCSAKPAPEPEVRDNFYYIGDSLQVSIFGNCKPKCTRGVYTSVASYGICFKKGNHLNCAGRLETHYPQTPLAAELLAAERAILLAKHTVRAGEVTIVTDSTYLMDNVVQWKKRLNSTEAEGLTPETWIEVKHINEIRRLCAALGGIKVKWTLGDLKDTRFKELQIAKNLSVQCEEVIQEFIAF